MRMFMALMIVGIFLVSALVSVGLFLFQTGMLG
jgi:hypothetical protein